MKPSSLLPLVINDRRGVSNVSLTREELEAKKKETLEELVLVLRELRSEIARAIEEKKRVSP